MRFEELLTAGRIAAATAGRIAAGGADTAFSSVSTDTRNIPAGALFVALEGENFDGHDFVAGAFEAGAGGALVQREPAGDVAGRTVIVVEDTLAGLGDIASLWRKSLPLRLLGITGSNGKTTTKEMAARVLTQRFRVHKNEANLNNLVGVPLTLFAMPDDTEVAVIEMGMNTPGEIARLTEIASPDFGLITNVGPAHLAGLGDIDGVKEAKGELFSSLRHDATLLVNGDDPRVVELAARSRNPRLVFGSNNGDDVRLQEVLEEGPGGTRFLLEMDAHTVEIGLKVPGRHHVANSLAAAASGLAFGLGPDEVARALSGYRGFTGRMEMKKAPGGFLIIDDTYNANPGSATQALKTLAGFSPGRRFAILGDMLELGPTSDKLHHQVGLAAAGGADFLFALGEMAPNYIEGGREGGMHEERLHLGQSHRELADLLLKLAEPGDFVLVKGSRGMRMEKVVELLMASGAA